MTATTLTQPAAAADDALQLVRRLDWRFLLPTPALGKVAWFGPRGPLCDVLQRFAGEVVASSLADGRAYSLAVVRNPDEKTLAAAASHVAGKGALYIEIDGAGGLAAVKRKLAALGFANVQAYWHWPNFETCAEIVPLASRASLRAFFGRRQSDFVAKAKSWIGRGLARLGLAGRLARSVSLVATRSAEPAPEPFLLVTPRFHASSHVVRLVLDPHSARPRTVVKTPRLPGHSASLLHEAEVLSTIHSGRREPLSSVPERLSLTESEIGPSLVQSALLGRPVDRRAVARRLPETCAAVIDWLCEIQPRQMVWADDDSTWHDRLVAEPLRTLELLADDPGDEQRLAEVRQSADSLRALRFPLVLEHGDLSPPNLLLLESGGVGAVDWELADARGLPAADLFFFLSFAAFARTRAARSGSYAAGFDGALFGRRGWALPYIDRYADRLALPTASLAPLAVLTWTRYLASLARRSTIAPGSAAATAAWLRTNRYYTLWRHTLTHRNRLCWLARP